METRVKVAIAALEDAGYVKREENRPRIFADSILVNNVEEAFARMEKEAHHFTGSGELDTAKRVFSFLISRARGKEDTRVDAMAEALGLGHSEIAHILQLLKQLRLIGGEKDLTAYFFTAQGAQNSIRLFKRAYQVELKMLDLLFPNAEVGKKKVYLRELNESILESGIESDLALIREILNYWSIVNYVKKERIDRNTDQYLLQLKMPREELEREVRQRTTAARWCLQVFQKVFLRQARPDQDAPGKRLMEFSLLGLKEEVERVNPQGYSLRFYERLLLYLHHLRVIELKDGLLIYYNPMKITRLVEESRKQYTKSDYQKLATHYDHKKEQVHIVGEYAKRQLRYSEEALQFADDYFTLPYAEFLNKYFPGEEAREVIRRSITRKKFQQLFGELSTEQLQVVKDKDHDRILVVAGPGSGKTRVLVHKVASLLLMEDVKPEQCLMLTFSRPAAVEFKTRLKGLVGKLAYWVDIFTFHGFAFQLAGRLGDLERAGSILPQVTREIEEEKISLDRILNKSVIVIDEFQDVSEQEYRFISAIIAKAEKIRVIAVGDDDQTIYEFRGARVQYMRDFRHQQDAKFHYLTINYRAKANLVAFTNRFLETQFGPDRLMWDKPLSAHQTDLGTIEIVRYQGGDLLLPLLEQVRENPLQGSAAVLTKTNQEAVLMTSLLRQQGVPVRLILEGEGFSLRNLLEIHTFTQAVFKTIADDLGLIEEDNWNQAKRQVEGTFSGSDNLVLFRKTISAYEATHSKKFRSTWNAYLRDARLEDLFHPEAESILVSTMHKAKGKEFDRVYVLLDRYFLRSEEKKRVLYVAMTRAKQELYIHTNSVDFSVQGIPNGTFRLESRQWPSPDTLILQCGMKDVRLGHFKRRDVARIVQTLQAGIALRPNPLDVTRLQTVEGLNVLYFSRKFAEKVQAYANKEFLIHSARIAFIVQWFDNKSGQHYRVVLPELTLQKNPPERPA